MPLYEYQCSECGHRFEILQRIGEGAEGLTCPRCDAPRPEKKFSTFASSTGGEAASSAGAGCVPGRGFS